MLLLLLILYSINYLTMYEYFYKLGQLSYLTDALNIYIWLLFCDYFQIYGIYACIWYVENKNKSKFKHLVYGPEMKWAYKVNDLWSMCQFLNQSNKMCNNKIMAIQKFALSLKPDMHWH